MEKPDAKKRIDKLVKQIDELRYRYHVLNDPTVSDEVYDSLQRELKDLEESFPELRRSDSPLQRVGGKPLDKFSKVKHQVRQWSLNDVFTFEEIYDWQTRMEKLLADTGEKPALEYVCELKIDGLHIVLTYDRGALKLAASRGDGIIGEDVTQNIRTIQSIPLSLKKPLSIIVEGEVWLSEKQLEKINTQRQINGLPNFANPRNAAAGTIRQLDPKVVAERKLDSFIYDWSGGAAKLPVSQSAELEELKQLGFKVNPHYQLCQDIKAVVEFCRRWQDKRKSQAYWVDGIVIKINQRRYQEKLGYIGKAPRWALAFKFPAEEVTTVVEDIKVQVGRLGTLTPVANLRPVKLAGTIVKRATLHNEDQIKRLGLKIGDTVIIRKAGEIIPEVVSVLPKLRTGEEREFKMPRRCPICNSEIKRQTVTQKGSEQSVAFFCTNPQCFAQNQRQILHSVSRKAFDIEGLGDKIVEQLMAEDLINDPADIFALKKEDLVGLERFADKSADNLISAINKAKRVSLPRFIYALGIQHVGEETAISLADRFGSLANLKKAALAELESVSDIGPVVAKSVYQYFTDKKNLAFLDKFNKLGLVVEDAILSKKTAGPLADKKIVVTGVLDSLSREEAKAKIRQAGGDWVSSISKNTDYLVAGQNPGSKYRKAKELGVKIIGEKEFLELFKQ